VISRTRSTGRPVEKGYIGPIIQDSYHKVALIKSRVIIQFVFTELSSLTELYGGAKLRRRSVVMYEGGQFVNEGKQ
jgi:hypothetical protein